MAPDRLRILERPSLQDARMVLGFSGWMDGGEVSTGTVEILAEKLGARVLAGIDADDFYLFSFPGSMGVSSLFRPHTKIEDGLITAFQGVSNTFFYSEAHNLILLLGKEPNLRWAEYGECIFSIASQFNVSTIYFLGSVAGLVPHTREPRMFGSVSREDMKLVLEKFRIRFSNYEGPGSICTYLTRVAPAHHVSMMNLVAEIPAYIQGRNHRCIETVLRRLAGILNFQIDLDDLRALGDRLEEQLTEVVQDRPELLERIRKLEEDYDSDIFDTEMGDLKEWLVQQGIRLVLCRYSIDG